MCRFKVVFIFKKLIKNEDKIIGILKNVNYALHLDRTNFFSV